jgi:TetR/AcrR family transcriptional repressor of nem operon
MGRPLKFDKHKILTKAMNCFWENGFDGTSTDDLEMATGIKRGSLYHTFKNKRQLYLTVLNHYFDIKMQEAINIVQSSDTLTQSVGALLQYAASDTDDKSSYKGCLLCDAAIECAAKDEDVAALVRNAFGELSVAISAMAKRSFTDANDDDLKAEADRIVAIYIGVRTYKKMGHTNEFLSGTFKRETANITRLMDPP